MGETAAAGKVTFHSNLPIYFVIERDSIVYKEDRPADAIDVSEEIMKNYGQNKYPAIKNSKVISIIDIYGLIDIIEIIMDIIIDFTKSTQPDQSENINKYSGYLLEFLEKLQLEIKGFKDETESNINEIKDEEIMKVSGTIRRLGIIEQCLEDKIPKISKDYEDNQIVEFKENLYNLVQHLEKFTTPTPEDYSLVRIVYEYNGTYTYSIR